MLTQNKVVLNLQLFADGTATGESTSAAPPVAATGETSSTAAIPEADNATAAEQVNEIQNDGTAPRQSFEELIKSKEYKAEADAFFKKKFGERYGKKVKPLEDRNRRMSEILGLINERYELDVNSDSFLDDLEAKIADDSKLYEDAAYARGMDVDNYKTVRTAERIVEQTRIANEQREREKAVRSHIDNLAAQAEQLKERFPSFDIEMEIQNPTFKKLTDPVEFGGDGLPVIAAFYALHHSDIEKGLGKAAVTQAKVAVAGAIAKNKARPAENGLSNNASAEVKRDIKSMTREDFERDRENFRRYGISPNI